MHDVYGGSRTASPGLRRLVGGGRPWGRVDVRADRYGLTRYRLTVYPPGITEAERRRVRLARGWPIWAAPVWIICGILFGALVGPWDALAISTSCYLGIGLAVVAMAGEQRRQVRTFGAVTIAGYDDPVSAEAVDRLLGLADRLIDADGRVQQGLLSPAEHEHIWWGVYDAIGTDRVATTSA